jgi:hypothetical protein
LTAAATATTITGGTGADVLTLASGTNVLSISDSDGIDVTGGAGVDTITFSAAITATTVDGAAGADVINLAAGTNTITIEATGATTTADIVNVVASANTTTIIGSGALSVNGSSGVDTISLAGSTTGAATIDAGAGVDIITLTNTTNVVTVVVEDGTAANWDTITGFATTVDKLDLNAITTATTSTDISAAVTATPGAVTFAADTVYFVGGGAAGDADGVTAAATLISAATWTDTVTGTSYVVVVDNNSSGLFAWTNVAGSEAATAELTLIGTIGAVLVAGDLVFA